MHEEYAKAVKEYDESRSMFFEATKDFEFDPEVVKAREIFEKAKADLEEARHLAFERKKKTVPDLAIRAVEAERKLREYLGFNV